METVGPYRIVKELGRGAMGVVFEAFDSAIGRTVAIKVIRSQQFATAEEDAQLKLRFTREAAAAGRLSHPNIVTVYQLGEHTGMQYLVMEFVTGVSLESMLVPTVPLDFGASLAILTQIAAALDYAHAAGVVHRDIKPANILVKPDGTAKLTDFGIARITSQTLTQTGLTMGTPAYMAPEQIMASRVDGRADQYSMAVVAYQMLAGRRPFEAPTDQALMFKIASEEPPPLNKVNELSPRSVAVAIHRGLSKDPNRRYQNCSELVASLRNAGLPPTVSTAPSGPPLSALAPVRPSVIARRPAEWPLFAACALVLLAGATWLGYSVFHGTRMKPKEEKLMALVAKQPVPAMGQPQDSERMNKDDSKVAKVNKSTKSPVLITGQPVSWKKVEDPKDGRKEVIVQSATSLPPTSASPSPPEPALSILPLAGTHQDQLNQTNTDATPVPPIYIDIKLGKEKKPHKFADIALLLRNFDLKKNRYSVDVFAGDEVTEEKDKELNEAVEFYTIKSGRTPYNLVINQITMDGIAGYLWRLPAGPTADPPAPGSTQLIGRIVWNGVPVPKVGVQVKQVGDYSLPLLASTMSAADGTFTIQSPPGGRLMIYALAPETEYWGRVGHPVTITAGQRNSVGDVAIYKKLQLLSPANQGHNGPTVQSTTPTLQWTAFPEAARYAVYVYNNATQERVFLQSVQNTTIMVSPALQSGQQYQWSVDAYNSRGQEIAYYSAWYFTIQ
jgi:serine/threonine-protein kinase